MLETGVKSGASRPRRAPASLPWLGKSLVIVVVVAALFVLANLGMNVLYYNRALPHEYLGRLSVGGKSLHLPQHISPADMLPAQLTFAHGSTYVSRTAASLGISADAAATLKNVNVHWHWLPLFSLFSSRHAAVSLQVDKARFAAASAELASRFARPARGRHIGLQGTAFVIEPAEGGYRLNTAALLALTLAALQHGTTQVSVPTTPTPAPAGTARNLSDQLPKLQKELDTPISFTYHGQTIRPAKADRSQWFVPAGASMAAQPAAAERYIAKLARQAGITIANPHDLAAAAAYALSKAETRTFAVVPAGRSTIVRTYCTSVRDVNASVLAGLTGNLAMTYNDVRGWNDGGRIAFEHVRRGCQYTVWMSAAADMTTFGSICDDYYNCQAGHSVVLNYHRWTTATPPWNKTGGSIQDYRTLMIDHETGHRLGFPDNPACPGKGRPAPVMMQQSMDLHGCVFNIWPRPAELTRLDRMLNLGQANSITNMR
jgi:Protein of unknown function (DUF3152)